MESTSFAKANRPTWTDRDKRGNATAPLSPREAYDIAAPYYDEWPWQKVWHASEWPLIQQAVLSAPRSSRVLDLGVGTGTYLGRLAARGRRLYGLDISWRMLQRARTRLSGRASLVQADATALPFERCSFDLIVINRVATHVSRLAVLTQEVRRLLDRDGTVIVSDISPHHSYSVTALPVDGRKIPVRTYKHTIQEWRKALRCAGLMIECLKEINDVDIPSLPAGSLTSIDRSGNRPIGFVFVARET